MRKDITPARRRVLEALDGAGEMTAGELAPVLGIQQHAINQHLLALWRAGLVAQRKDGWCFRYSTLPQVAGLLRSLAGREVAQ